MEMKKRCKDRRGFTIGEMMMAVLILVIITGLVAGGLPLAGRVYKQVVDSANAQLLLGSTMTLLRNELETAKSVPTPSGTNQIQYTSTSTGYTTIFWTAENADDADDGIWIAPYQQEQVNGEGNVSYTGTNYERPLVSRAGANLNLHTEFSSWTYANGVFTIKGLVVKRGDTVLAGQTGDTLYIRSLVA